MAKKPKRANLKGPGKCIFCGGGGLSHEHVWADWLRDYVPRTLNEHRYRSALLYPGKEDATIKRQTGDPHARRLYIVCKRCNNEWMSELQTAVKPFLVPLLTGQVSRLHRRAQTTLAAWVAMTVMVAEFLYPDRGAIPQSDRTWLYENQTSPPHWRIWLGRQQHRSVPMYFKNVITLATDEEAKTASRDLVPEGNTQTTTICLGQHLLIHVMSSVPKGHSIIRRWKLPPHFSAALTEILPIRAPMVRWPRRDNLILSDTGIDELANEFFRRVTTYMNRTNPDAPPFPRA